jgi:microcystin-dependent protein
MAQPFVGEIRPTGFNFAPVDWLLCNGQLVSINENEALYNLIGTTYGGDGVNTFGIPDLQGRVPIHQGTDPISGATYVMGQRGGSETVTLTLNQIPIHTHPLNCQSASGSAPSPSGNFWATSNLDQFSSAVPSTPMGAAVGQVGGSQPHDNMSPFTVLNYIIAQFGIYPSQG